MLSDEGGASAPAPAAVNGGQSKLNFAQKGNGGTAAREGNAAGNSGADYKSAANAEQTEQLKKRAYCLLYDFIQKKE